MIKIVVHIRNVMKCIDEFRNEKVRSVFRKDRNKVNGLKSRIWLHVCASRSSRLVLTLKISTAKDVDSTFKTTSQTVLLRNALAWTNYIYKHMWPNDR